MHRQDLLLLALEKLESSLPLFLDNLRNREIQSTPECTFLGGGCFQCIKREHPRVSCVVVVVVGIKSLTLLVLIVVAISTCCSFAPGSQLLHTPLSVTYFLKECTKKDRYRSGFGGIKGRFDLRIPSTGIENCLEVIYQRRICYTYSLSIDKFLDGNQYFKIDLCSSSLYV